MPLRVLVTGATGFIGRALACRLSEKGFIVSCLGRTGSPLPDQGQPIVIERFSRDCLLQALQHEKFDIVYHLAAYGVAPDQRNAVEMADANILGTGAIVEAAAATGAREWNL